MSNEYSGMTDEQIAQYNLARAAKIPRSDDEIKAISDVIRQTGYQIHLYLGTGYLEKVYENALKHRLEKLGHWVDAQVPLIVRDEDGFVIGNYNADLLVDSRIIIELKATKALDSTHEAQLMNYMKTTGIKDGMLINFGSERYEVRKFVK